MGPVALTDTAAVAIEQSRPHRPQQGRLAGLVVAGDDVEPGIESVDDHRLAELLEPVYLDAQKPEPAHARCPRCSR